MEAQGLDKECRAVLCSLDGVSWFGSTPALTEEVAGLEADLGFWSCPFHFPENGPLMPFVESHGADASIYQPASALLHNTPSPCSTACFSGDATSSVPAGQLDLVPVLSSDQGATDATPAGKAQCSLSLTSSAERSEDFQLPLIAALGLPSIDTLDNFWDMPWDDAAIVLCGAADGLCTATAFSPSHSLDMDSCQSIVADKRDAPADLLCPAQRAGSADSEASCASAAVPPVKSPLPDQVCLPEARVPSSVEAPAKTAAAPVSPSSTAGPPLRATTHPAADDALFRPASAPAAAEQPPYAAADPAPCQPLALPASPGQLAAAARPPPGAALVGLAARPGPAAALGHCPQPGRPRPLATVLKVRQQQQAYHRRKKVRVAAVHARAGGLKERLAALEGDVGALLGRHEELTREQPWHQQHEEIKFMAGLATLLPDSIACHSSSASYAAASELLRKFMLEPTATVSTLCKSGARGLPDTHRSHDIWKTQATQPTSEDSGLHDGTGVPWSSVLECLQLTRAQRDDIAALYEEYLQEAAAAHHDCLAIACQVQVLPSVNGELTACAWPNMAACLVSSQLSSQAAREDDMVTSLTAACHKVLSPMQQRNLQILAPETAKEDLRDLCREVSAACRAPRKSPLSPPAKPAQPEAAAAQPAAHAPQESQVVSCHKTRSEKEGEIFGEGSTSPPATIIHDVAALAAAGNATAVVPAESDDIIRDLTSIPSRVLRAALETRGIQVLQNAPLLPSTDEQPVSGDIVDDMAPVPAWTQLAPLEKVEPVAPGNASAQMPAAAVVPACDVALESAALMMVAAQLAAVPCEAAFNFVISAAQHKRQAAVAPKRPKEPYEGTGECPPTKALATPAEAAPLVRPHEEHRKKARKMSSLSSLHQGV